MERINSFVRERYVIDSEVTCNKNSNFIRYLRPGLKSEIGEIYGPLKKVFRESPEDWPFNDHIISLLKGEIGDVFWYIANLSRLMNAHDIVFNNKNHSSAKMNSIFKLKLDSIPARDYNVEMLECKCDEMMTLAIEFNKRTGKKNDVSPQILLIIYKRLIEFCIMCSFDPVEIMEYNTKKLFNRLKEGTINGSGDFR